MREKGYYRFASVHGELIIFTCEDDLWSVSTGGGLARRLTTGRGEFLLPKISPSGAMVAFTGQEEGHQEIYAMPIDGGSPQRLTYTAGTQSFTCGWKKDSSAVLFTTEAKSPFLRHTEGFSVPAEGGDLETLNLGHALTLSQHQDGRFLIGRNSADPARWKRYKGGTAGDIWVEEKKGGTFKRLISLDGNIVWPMWIGERVYFLSDHQGVGNIYSCDSDGEGLQRHTNHVDYFVRFPSTDGEKISYTAGGEIYLVDVKTSVSKKIDVRVPAATGQISRRFVEAKGNIEHVSAHPENHSAAMIVRGQAVTMPFWEDAPIQHGVGSSVRYRLCEWLNDGKRFVVISDAGGRERLEIHWFDNLKETEILNGLDLGRTLELNVHPTEDIVAIANHRQELLLIDLKSKKVKVLDRSPAERLSGLAWSADGRWLAYSWSPSNGISLIRLCDTKNGRLRDITNPIKTDVAPCFDPDGKYLYFLSNRDFLPIYDDMQFALGFIKSIRPFAIALKKNTPSPLFTKPKAVSKASSSDLSDDVERETKKDVDIDFDGIQGRVIGLPVDEGQYRQIMAGKNRILFTEFPVKGIRPDFNWMNDEEDNGSLIAYDFQEGRKAVIAKEVGLISHRAFSSVAIYNSNKKLRVIDINATLPEQGQEPKVIAGECRKSGWIDTKRVKLLIEPIKEWRQMYEECWRLQKDQFWDAEMSSIDWQHVHDKYVGLLGHLRSRAELSDVIWEMQGELGTSHAYEMGGDYRRPNIYTIGCLGADLEWEPKLRGYQISRILRGDSWQPGFDSALSEPGLEIEEGDLIYAVSGVSVSEHLSVQELLLNQAEKRVALTVGRGKGVQRVIYVTTLGSERMLRYREWVEANRKRIHDASGGDLGYVHIPDMGPWGFAEFHRSYLSEINRKGLIIDARYNRGGHVSPLLLERLRRKRVGYDISRWGVPQSYPPESVVGPIVCITNQFAGSDGDIFSHCFKLYGLGPLVGKRTWGGVIGIWPRHKLVDGTVTTQPEFSFWFKDVGWSVENYGTDPDYDVDIAPHHYRDNVDPQMDKAIDLGLNALKNTPADLPDFGARPSLPLPQVLCELKKQIAKTK